MNDQNINIKPVILAGGYGKRLWPLSTRKKPKQFLKLGPDGSLLQSTLKRLTGGVFGSPTIIGNAEHEDILKQHAAHIILEAEGRGTAFSIAVAARLEKENPEQVLAFFPADHVFGDTGVLQSALIKCARHAKDTASICVLGIKPDHPSTAYGYIQTGEKIDDILAVERFTEKPDKKKAERFFNGDRYLWNCGIFVAQASTFKTLFERRAPDTWQAAGKALQNAKHQNAVTVVTPGQCPNISFDYAVMEKLKSGQCSAVQLNTYWTDLGTWPSLIKHLLFRKTA